MLFYGEINLNINIDNLNFTQHTVIIEKINTELRNQTKSWKLIASQFALAQDQFGTDSDSFKSILKGTGFHKSTANKLVIVGRSERVQDLRFEKVHAWTVLYDICGLTEDQYKMLLNKIDAGCSNITSSMVKSVKDVGGVKDAYASLFEIRVDSNAMRSGKFSPTDYESVIDLVDIIKGLPYVRVDRCCSFENIHDQYLKAINDNMETIWSKHRADAVSQFKEAFIKANGSSDQTKPLLEQQTANLLEMWKIDRQAFFAECGYAAPSEAEIYDGAILKFEEKRNKLISKVSDPYSHANTDFSVAKSPLSAAN
jgi:hypothetical protein